MPCRVSLLVLLLAFVCLQAAWADEQAARVWTSRDGRFRTTATLLKIQQSSVILKQADGNQIEVSLDSLSPDDVQFIFKAKQSTSQTPPMGRINWGDQLESAVDLIGALDLAKATIRGNPKQGPEGLTLPRGERTIVGIPAQTPPQYQLAMTLERQAGDEALFLGLMAGGKRVALGLDGYKRFSELSRIDGSIEVSKVTRYRGQRLRPDTTHDIVVTVHHHHIHVSIDGTTFLNWHGDTDRFQVVGSDWNNVPDDGFVLIGYGAQFLISRMELREITKSQVQPRKIDSQEVVSSVALIESGSSSGSGFMAARNLVVTNHHVIADAVVADLKVHFGDSDKAYPVASVVYSDPQRDLAILLVEADVLPLSLCYDNSATTGNEVKVYGNPSVGGGIILKNAVVGGKIGANVRIAGADYLQIDAKVNPGSSGGPILSSDRQVVAVTAMKANEDAEASIREGITTFSDKYKRDDSSKLQVGIAFGIPASDVTSAIDIVLKQSPEDAANVSAQHDLLIVFERLVALVGLRYIEALAMCGQHIKHQAFVASSQGKAGGMCRMLSPGEDLKMQQAFKSGAAREIIAVLSENLDRDIQSLKNNRAISSRARSSLATLDRLLPELARFANQNHANYATFSQSMLQYEQQLERSLTAVAVEVGLKDE